MSWRNFPVGLTTFVRTRPSRQKPMHRKEWESQMIKSGNIKYYPRYPDHKDPPIQPSKLFMVYRVKPLKGQPWWNREIMLSLGFTGKRTDDYAIVKNMPSECSKLWRVKHLVKINPIRAEGEPTEEDTELGATYLHQNGKFQRIEKVNPARIEATETFMKDPKRMDKYTIRRQLLNKWLNSRE